MYLMILKQALRNVFFARPKSGKNGRRARVIWKKIST